MTKSSFFPLIFLIFLLHSCADGEKKNGEIKKDIPFYDKEIIISEIEFIEKIEEKKEKESYYKIKIEFPEGKVFEFDRDLTGLDNKFAFGSTHIAPAISFAMADTIYTPVYAKIEINFGIIKGSSTYPVQTPEEGEYPFAPYPPEVKVFIKDIQYCSCVEGSEGNINLSSWALDEGGLFEGDFKGKILQDTKKEKKLWLKVEGNFHFILPEPQGGQPE